LFKNWQFVTRPNKLKLGSRNPKKLTPQRSI
jgi:hypothetical protein